MNKSGLISLIVILSLIVAFFYLPYIEFLDPEQKLRRSNQLIDHFDEDEFYISFSLFTLFFPILFIIESTFWSNPRRVWNRILLIVQGALIAWGGLIVWFLMSFNIFSNGHEYRALFYLILAYLILGVVWSFFLAIPYFDNNKIISGTFRKLSLSKPKLH